MEFDNDRLIRPINKLEIFCWSVLVLGEPFITGLTVFWHDMLMVVLLLMICLVMLPGYILFSRFVSPLLFKSRKWFFIPSAIVSFGLVLALISGIYVFIRQFDLSAFEDVYFSWSAHSLLRESAWIASNLSLATIICYLKLQLDEKQVLADLRKDNNFFKLRYLRSQLNPHFLFNTLNSIYALSLQKSDLAPEMVIKLADLMRYLIYECNEDKIALDKEIEFIRNYIEIEKVRHTADVKFSIEGNSAGIFIEPFLFISFIENGFKHAVNDSRTQPFIYITIKIEPEQIKLNVINNTNIDLATQAKRINGKGMTTSRGLLELLYPDSYALDIIQTQKDSEGQSALRLKNARECLASLYPDSHTLDVILSNNAFTVSLVVKPVYDQMHNS